MQRQNIIAQYLNHKIIIYEKLTSVNLILCAIV